MQSSWERCSDITYVGDALVDEQDVVLADVARVCPFNTSNFNASWNYLHTAPLHRSELFSCGCSM